MLLTSPSFENNEVIPKKFTQEGGNINPELQIHNVPHAAKSLALIMHDPDAPLPGGFTHWVVWNISPATTLIKQESVPPGSTEGNERSGQLGYQGPMPPIGHGAHHYEFRLYALDVMVDLPAGSTTKDDLEGAMRGHILKETKLVGLYERNG